MGTWKVTLWPPAPLPAIPCRFMQIHFPDTTGNGCEEVCTRQLASRI
jgi:hypothetical protein